MQFTDHRIPVRLLAVGVYLLVLVLLVVLLVREVSKDKASFSLAKQVVEASGQNPVVQVTGQNLHPGLKGVLVHEMVNDEALVWQHFKDIPSNQIALRDDLLLFSTYGNGRVVSAKFDGMGTPELLGSIQFPETISKIGIVDDVAIVGMQRHGGFALIDIRDPQEMKLVAQKRQTGLFSDLVLKGETVFYTDVYSGVGRVDLSSRNPEAETLAVLESPWRIARIDDKLAVGTLKGEVHLFEIEEEGTIRPVGQIAYPANVRGVAFTDEALAVILADGTLFSYDLLRWPDFLLVGQLILTGNPLSLSRVPGKSELVATFASGGVAHADLSEPGAPFLLRSHRVAKTFRGLVFKDNIAVGAGNFGLEAISLAVPEDKSPPGSAGRAPISWGHGVLKSLNNQVVAFDKKKALATLGSPLRGAGGQQNIAFVANSRVHVFSRQEDGVLNAAGEPVPVDGATAVEFVGDSLFVSHRKGLKVMQGPLPDALREVGTLPLAGWPLGIEMANPETLLIATRDAGVHFVDVSMPEHPRLITSLSFENYQRISRAVNDIVVKDTLAFVSFGTEGVYVVDISDPGQPELQQIIRSSERANKMVMHDDLLLVADGTAGLFIIDTAAQEGIIPVGGIQTPVRIDEMAIAGEQLYVSSHPGGMIALPLPRRLPKLKVLNDQQALVELDQAALRQYVYLYDERNFRRVKVVFP